MKGQEMGSRRRKRERERTREKGPSRSGVTRLNAARRGAARRGAKAGGHEDTRARARERSTGGGWRGDRSGIRGGDKHAGASVPRCLSRCWGLRRVLRSGQKRPALLSIRPFVREASSVGGKRGKGQRISFGSRESRTLFSRDVASFIAARKAGQPRL